MHSRSQTKRHGSRQTLPSPARNIMHLRLKNSRSPDRENQVKCPYFRGQWQDLHDPLSAAIGVPMIPNYFSKISVISITIQAVSGKCLWSITGRQDTDSQPAMFYGQDPAAYSSTSNRRNRIAVPYLPDLRLAQDPDNPLTAR